MSLLSPNRDVPDVLIIEDDPKIVKLLTLHLGDIGLSSEAVSSGNRGLKRALEGDYRLVILDLMLPGLDGFEICKKIRAEKGRVPILMLTAKSEELDKVLGLELGADDYITKPFSIRELLARAYNRMADTIAANMERLRQTDSLRRELIANVSHDLRSPLTSIQGYIETLLMKQDSLKDDQIREYLQVILSDATKLNEMVHELFELSKYEARQIEPKVELLENERRAWVRVIDIGTGIEQRDIPFIFDRFFSGRREGASSGKGSGLGLAIAQKIVELHGSTIRVESKPGRGSIFFFELLLVGP
jgi:signal transduction histidine kinase